MFWGIDGENSGGNPSTGLGVIVSKKRYLIYFQITENHVACQPLPEIFTHDDNHQPKNNT